MQVAKSGDYDINLRFDATRAASSVHFALNGVSLKQNLPPGATEHTFRSVRLRTGSGKLESWIARDGQTVGVQYAHVKRVS